MRDKQLGSTIVCGRDGDEGICYKCNFHESVIPETRMKD
jgi:hypothetical protein